MKMSNPVLIAMSLASLMATGCSKRTEESAGYQAACQGPPLHTVERREKAMQDGYEILRPYDCISKASFEAIAEQKAQWEAAHTPEAIARQEAEFAEKRQQYAEKLARESAAKENVVAESQPEIVLHPVDVNTATETEIANVISIGPEVAAQVIKERNKRRFTDWPDLANRVVGLSAAQTAMFASTCGLTVDAKSLSGAPPNAALAASIANRYQRK
jgi:DNA uptake protein ComE-like DNA-binding protein